MPPLDETRRDTQENPQVAAPPVAGADNLRAEAYRRPEGQRLESVNSVLSQNFDNPVSHLDNARNSLKRGDFQGAEREYFAAIVAADKIDQREVTREREKIKQSLQAEQDPTKRRQLVEWDMSLNDMQRAPGFTRANLGLCYIRMGYHLEGHRMLVEAARLDPQMENDPNFIRRLQALGRPMPGREDGIPGATDAQGRPIPGQPARPGDTSVAPPPDGRTPTPADRVAPPSGTSRHDAQNFDNPFTHIAKANEGFAKGAGKLTPEAKAEYEAAIKAADSIDRAYLAQQTKTLQEALVKAYPEETKTKVTALEKQRDDMLNALPKDKQDALKGLATKLDQATTAQDQETIKKQMRDLVPDISKKQDEIDTLTAQPRAILEQLAALEHLNNSSALSRFAYAEALRQSGDKASARTMLEQVAKLDPEAAKDDKFKQAATDVGLTLTPATATSDRPAERTVERPAPPGGTGAAQDDPQALLLQAHEKNAKEGFAAAKPLFEKAVAAADKIDQTLAATKLKEVEDALKTETDAAKKQQLMELGQAWSFYKNSPVVTRFQMAIAQNNSGDYAGAKTALDELAKKSPDIAKEAAFKTALEANTKQQKITDEALQAAAVASPGTTAGGDTAENPYSYIQKATALFDPKDPTKQNAKSAEAEWKKAIESADKLPVDQYKTKLAEVEAQIKTETDPLKSQELLKLKEGLKELVDLPSTLRVETATFYLQNAKPDEAKAMLEQALQKNPALKDQERFKQLVAISQENSKDTIDKALGFLKSTGKELLADGISGGVGLAAFSLTPGGRVLKLGSAVLAGGATKHGLSMAGLGGDASAPLKNFAWGGVDALAMVSGAGVRNKMMGNFERSLTGASAKEMLLKGGVTSAEKLALVEGKSGMDALKAATAVLTEQSVAKKTAASAALKDAVAAAPLWQKPLVWAQGHSPLLWRIPTKSMETFAAREREYLAAKGSRMNYLNPLNMFASPNNYSGTLRNLEARTFWNRYKIDAVSVGATSAVYRGSHEAVRVGDVDPVTGQKYSAYDAVTNTALGTVGDGISGGFLVAGFRGMGGFFTKHSGVAGEANPLVRPTGPAALGADAGLGSRFAQGGRYAWHYGARMPKYGMDLVGKKIGDAGTAGSQWLSQSPRVQTSLSVIPTGAALFSPKLYEAYGAYEKTSEYEKILAEIQKPLEDKTPVQPLPSDAPAKPADGATTAQPTDKPAEKPAEQLPAANPQPGAKQDGVGEGLPE